MRFFKGKTLYSPLDTIDQALVGVEDGRIARVTSADRIQPASGDEVIDFGDSILVPGFIDVHIHGAVGQDVMQAGREELRTIETFLARHGVTAYFPTTVTAALDFTLTALERLADAIESRKNGAGRAQPLGIHLEGPFLSPVRRGVHPPKHLLPPSMGNFDRLWQAARGHVRLMTIAPELVGAEEVIAQASQRGVCVSLGHSDADLAAARRGVAAGARHATHTFNAMRPLDHRQPGILGEVLTNPHLTADVIADGIHVDATVIELLVHAKGAQNVVLITDGISATGMPDGRYQLGDLEVELKDGRCLADGKLAGSVLTLDRAVQNVVRFTDWDLQRSVRAATLNPATATATPTKGVLRPGADADITVLTPDGHVRTTIIAGAVAH
jgi:N-acetylglucosamine-6-phosphate deacetylase